MSDENEYVYVREVRYIRKKIPKGHVKCRACGGTGEIRIRYGPPWDSGQFTTCWYCGGKGYVEKWWAEMLDKNGLPALFWKKKERDEE